MRLNTEGTYIHFSELLVFVVCKMEIKTVILLWKKSNIHLIIFILKCIKFQLKAESDAQLLGKSHINLFDPGNIYFINLFDPVNYVITDAHPSKAIF